MDDAGQIRYHIDPTITGVLKERDDWVADKAPAVNLKDDLNNLKETVKLPADGPDSPLQTFHVWNNSKEAEAANKDVKLKGDYSAIPEGEYLVDDAGAVRYAEPSDESDHEVRGAQDAGDGHHHQRPAQRQPQLDAHPDRRRHRRDDGVVRRVVAGVRGRRLHSDGVFDADFPGRAGPLGRGLLDDARPSPSAAEAATAEERARAEVEAIAKTETSPGVLLSSGLIAGGSLAGVTIAFLEFAPWLKNVAGFLRLG